MNVIVACEESQRVCMAFRERGHNAFSCDIQKPSGVRPAAIRTNTEISIKACSLPIGQGTVQKHLKVLRLQWLNSGTFVFEGMIFNE